MRRAGPYAHARAGVADQDPTCRHGDPECAKPGTAPCVECFLDAPSADQPVATDGGDP